MANQKTEKKWYYLYAIKSHTNGLWYIGLTGDPDRRRQTHIWRRRDLYAEGHTWRIIARRKSLLAIGLLERKAIKEHGTVWPGGNNLHRGGLTGSLLAFVRKYGPDADARLLQEGSAFSALTIQRMRQAQIDLNKKRPSPLKGRKKSAATKALLSAAAKLRAPTFQGKKHSAISIAKMHFASIGRKSLGRKHNDATKDKIAATRIMRRIESKVPLTYAGMWAQRKLAWKRFDDGKPAFPGTEHYLLQGRPTRKKVTGTTRQKMAEAQRARIRRERLFGTYIEFSDRRRHFNLSQNAKDAIALTRMRKTKKLSYKAKLKRHRKAWARHHQGLQPLPGTEHYLLQPEFHRGHHKHTDDARRRISESHKQRYAKIRAAGIKISAPKRSATYRMSQEDIDRATATKIRKGIANGLHYNYKQILKCSAKAKKRHAAGLAPIAGTECFVRLQTAPKWKSGATREQRAEYQRVMIDRVNAWLRQYGIKRGWIKS